MLRSLKVSNGWLKRVKQALSRYDFSSQKALAEELEISPRKASDFFNGKSVDYDVFVAICARLGLEWQKVAKVSSEIMKSIETSSQVSAKAQELDPVPQPELAKNIEDQAKKPDGIPKLASSLFRTFESQDYIPQKKFINVKSTDSPDSIEKSPDQLLDQSLDPVEQLVSEVIKPNPEPIPEGIAQLLVIENIGIEEIQEIQLPEPKIENKDLVQILEPLEPKLLEVPTNLSENIPPSNTQTIAQELPTIAATHKPDPDQPKPEIKLEIKQIEPTKGSRNLDLLNLSDLLNCASIPVKSPVKKEEVITTKPLTSNQVLIQIASQIPSKVPNSVTAPIIATIPQSYQPSSNNLEPILTAFYSAYDAQDWDLAADIVNDINLTYIKKTSDLALILDLYNQLLPPKWQDGEQKISDRLSHWQVLFNAGLAASYLEKYTDAVAYYETALAIASNSESNLELQLEGNTALKIKALNGLGLIYQAVAQYQSALKYFQQAQVLAKESQDHPSELQALGNLGNIYYASRQYRTAINYYQGFLQLANGEDEIELEFLVIGNLGNAYYNLGEYQAAINYQQKYLEIAQMIENSEKEAGCLVSLGFTYYSLGLYQTAIEHYQNAKAIADKFTYQRTQLSIFSGLGLSYQALKNYSTAVVCFHKCLEIAQKLGDRSAEVKALYNLRKANSYQ